MFTEIKKFGDNLIDSFGTISNDRKKLLLQITDYIQHKKDQNLPIHLVYICTHNSRRSHFGQVWAAVAACYYGVPNVFTYSGGTEATAFNHNAINSLKKTGFVITNNQATSNPIYTVAFGEGKNTSCFSKVYNHTANPQSGFVAIMTCSDADENCPFISGVELRIGTTYDDPKAFDNTNLQDVKYDERSRQIALETFFVFSQIQ